MKSRNHNPHRARNGTPIIGLIFLATPLLFWLSACKSSLGVPSLARESFTFGTEGLPSSELAQLWVSYQITVDSIDGNETGFRAPEQCLYYLISLPAGGHTLGLRLDYTSAIHRVRTAVPKVLQVDLVAGEAYRLIDLGAGSAPERIFQPWIQAGAPERKTLSIN